VLPRFEASLEPAQLALRGGCRCVGLRGPTCLGRGAGTSPLALELDAECGELLLDGPHRTLALVEEVSLRGRELALGGRFGRAGVGLGEACSQLVLAFCDMCRFGRNLGGPRLELALARLERMCPLECGPLSRDDCVGPRGSLLPGLRGLAAVESALELREVTLARGLGPDAPPGLSKVTRTR